MPTPLRTSLVPSSLTRELIVGEIVPDGVPLEVADHGAAPTSAIIEANSKAMVALGLDLAEMSFGTYTRARDRGIPLVALPIFPGRRFLEPGVLVAPGSSITSPAELRGKRAVTGQFWQTATIWHRVILHQGYGVAQDDLSWTCLAPERWDALPTPMAPLHWDTSGRDALTLLTAGEADVALLPRGRDGATGSGPRPLYADVVQAQRDFFQDTGFFPIIHLIVLREELARDADLVASLCAAFDASKQRGLAAMIADTRETPITDGDPAAIPALFGPDPWPYGITPNRPVLEAYLDDVFAHQHLTDRRLSVEELFPANLPAALR